MAIDLRKNRNELLKTWKDIFDEKSDTNWAVFGYEGKTNTLKVTETGEDGLEELSDEFNDGKVLYAGIKVIDPNTNLPKIVFINWSGEGVPSSRKGVCANHIRDIENLFKGAHVVINARNEDDVDEKVILEKVKKASGAAYSAHKEKAQKAEPILPVGSVYQRTNIGKEINVNKRDQFWASAEQQEKQRIKEEKKAKIQKANEFERKRKEREAKESERREEEFRVRSKSIDEQKKHAKQLEEKRKEEEKQRWERQRAEDERDQQLQKARADSLRDERMKEAESLIQKGKNEKPRFEERKAAPPPERPPKKKTPGPLPKKTPVPQPEPVQEPEPEPVHESEPTPAPVHIPKPMRPPSDSEEEQEDQWEDEPQQNIPEIPHTEPQPVDDTYEEITQESQKAPPAHEEPEDDLYENVEVTQAESLPAASSNDNISARALYDYQAENETEISFDPGDIITNISEIDDGWWQGTAPNGQFGMFPANYVEKIDGEEQTQAESGESSGIRAQALYDYQATDDSEISFDPGDIITDIEMVDEGWWRGTGPDGSFGMFPANYVEVIS